MGMPVLAVLFFFFLQPSVKVIFKILLMTQATIQLNKRQSSLTIEGNRGYIEPYMKLILIFLGNVSEVSASAPAAGGTGWCL